VMEGLLVCSKCERTVPIRGGVPDFVAAAAGGDNRVEQTTSGFARNWWRYSDVILASPALNDELFRDWVWPLAVDRLEGKRVLDAGCGMGRWMTVAAPHQPEMLVGFDYSDVIWAAFKNTKHLKNVHAVRADIFDLPFRPVFDVTYSIGVVHHTPDPAGAFRSLVNVTKEDGVLSVWVYGAENNEWIHKYVTPVRETLTSRLPDSALHMLSRVLSAQLLTAARAYVAFAPSGSSFSYDAYVRHLLKYPARYVEHIVYDHLVPELAQYVPRAEIDRWVADNGLHAVVSARNENSWRLVGSRSKGALERYTENPS
jgi:SAM-dependent methyltransferase